MIRLGLRLTIAGGREAINRLVLIVVAVAIGVSLLLGTLAGLNAVQAQNDRYAWLETGYTGGAASVGRAGDPMLWRLRADFFAGKEIGRVDLAATGPASPVPPGMASLPAPGQYYASPAMAALLRHTPPAELADRYPGRLVGTIGSAALPSPDSLLIVIGHTVADLSGQQGVRHVDRISTVAPQDCAECVVGLGVNYSGLVLVLAVVAAALLFPVLILIGGATRLSAARREQRFAAMRLVGATPRQVATIATVESVVASAIGAVVGVGLFFVLRPALAMIPFTGQRFFAADVSPNIADLLLVLIGLPLGAAAAARFALRRVIVSPLGVTRRVAAKQPSVWRVLPLLAGIVELGYFAYADNIGAGTGTSPTVEAVVFLAGVLLIMSGLVIVGPLLTMLAARVAIRRANRATTLLAARRLADDPQARFRAISGVVLAVFVGTCASAIITAIVAGSGRGGTVDARLAHTVVDFVGGPDRARGMTAVPDRTAAALAAVPGLTGLAVVRAEPVSAPPGVPPALRPIAEVISCADLAAVPALGHCPLGATAVYITPDYNGSVLGRSSMPDTTWHAADVSAARLSRLPVDSVVVGTDGSRSAIERARTILDLALPATFAAQTVGEINADSNRLLNDYRRLAEIVVLASLPIAGCSLAVNIVGGLAERKRPFSLLRLTGTPLRLLRRMIGLETAVPMLVTAIASVGAGLLAAQLFLRAQLDESLRPMNVGFYAVLVGGVLAALLVGASVLPLLNRMTGPEVARND